MSPLERTLRFSCSMGSQQLLAPDHHPQKSCWDRSGARAQHASVFLRGFPVTGLCVMTEKHEGGDRGARHPLTQPEGWGPPIPNQSKLSDPQPQSPLPSPPSERVLPTVPGEQDGLTPPASAVGPATVAQFWPAYGLPDGVQSGQRGSKG